MKKKGMAAFLAFCLTAISSFSVYAGQGLWGSMIENLLVCYYGAGTGEKPGAPGYEYENAVSVTEKSADSENLDGTFWAYIRNMGEDMLEVDVTEYLDPEENADRIAELGLTEADLVGDYAIYNPSEDTIIWKLDEETKYSFVDWGRDFVQSDDFEDLRIDTGDAEMFREYLGTYQDSKPGMPFRFVVEDGIVKQILEVPMA